MSQDNFEIESEVHDLKDKSVVGDKQGLNDSTIKSQPTPPLPQPKDGLPQEVEDSKCCFAPEMDWMLSLMQDKELLNLRDVISYRQDMEEYFRNPKCHIPWATMEYIKSRIDEELKYRRTR